MQGEPFRLSPLLIALSLPALCPDSLRAQCDPRQTAKILPNYRFSGVGDIALRRDRMIIGDPVTGEGEGGAAYIYERTPGGEWARTALLVCPDGNPWKEFGWSVDLQGDVAVVGARGFDAWKNDGVYAFVRDQDGTWSFEAKIVPDDWKEYQFFDTVSFSKDRMVVSASGDEDPDYPFNGAAYVFRRSPEGQWSQEAKLIPSEGKKSDSFGFSVSLDGERAAVGMYSSMNTGGRFYLFERQDFAWVERAIITPPAVGGVEAMQSHPQLAGNTILVQAAYRVNEDPAFYQFFVYRHHSESLWELEAALAPVDWPDGVPFGTFRPGAVSENLALIGDFKDDTHGEDSGIVYAFWRGPDGKWSEAARFSPADNGTKDRFGGLIALDGARAAVLASGDINPDNLHGSVYIYDLSGCAPCPADCTADGALDLFDFLCFVNAFNNEDPSADCDQSDEFDLFDFLCFANAFNEGC
jgi:hypothetical protein